MNRRSTLKDSPALVADTAAADLDALVLSDPRYGQHIRWRSGDRLDRLFERQCDWLSASDRAGQLAVDAGYATMTYHELDSTANQLARHLLALGAKAGDRIGLLFDRGLDSYLAMLAVLKMHAAYVPLDAGSPTDRLQFILTDAEVTIVISTTTLRERLPGLASLGPELVLLDQAADAMTALDYTRLSETEHDDPVDDPGDGPVDDLAYLIYTSGSTGRPKGVAITHANICNFVQVAAEVYGITTEDRVYQGMTIAFDFSIEETWVPWMSGATVVPKPAGPSLLGHELHEFLTAHAVTAMCCVPTLLATIDDDLPDLRFLLVSGEACPRDLLTRWHREDRRFLNVYGPTEATVTATWTELHPDRPLTIGVPLPTYSTVILDPDHNRALPTGHSGEIGIAGIGLALGYLNRDDLTEKAFIDDFLGIEHNPSNKIYRTGDLGRVSANGEIEYLGRIDTQIKIRGYRIELTEIESVLLEVPGIAQAVADTYHPEPGTVELVAYYSRRADTQQLHHEHILTRLRERLPAYMVPAYLEQLDTIPMTPQDKTDRKALPPPTGPRGAAVQGRYLPPTNPTETLLCDTLATVLRMERVSIDSDFFAELGADSLLMAQFCGKLRKIPEVRSPSIGDVYRHPTVRGLATHLGDSAAAAAAEPAEPVREPLEDKARVPTGTAEYLVCGMLQLLISLVLTLVGASILVTGFGWISGAVTATAMYQRSLVFGVGGFLFACALPIAAKWALVGRWKRQQIPIWSLAYVRFWTVKTLIQVNPLVLFAGSPLYVLYLRCLGARIGSEVAIFSRRVPVCTDLLTIGDRTVIRSDSSFTCYRAHTGQIQIAAVTLGADVLVSDATVLDIETSMGDGAQLGHASALLAGQSVPAGQRWHGSPAQPTDTDFRTVPPIACGAVRKVVYSVAQLVPPLLLGAPLVLTALVLAFTRITVLAGLIGEGFTGPTTWRFYALAAGIGTGLLLGGLLLGVLAILIIPRLLNLAVKPDRVYPLCGVHYWLAGVISALTNTGFNNLAGDSSYVVHYLRALGYNLSQVVQTGSNFGLIMKHNSPYLSTVGTGTMVSDGLTIANSDVSNTSFRLSRVAIGAYNFLGNHITYPTRSRAGENVLLATKVMVPIDGPMRKNVGLLGSPAFEIPRSVERDGRFDELKTGAELGRRLAAKLRHNTVTILLFLGLGWFLSVGGVLLALTAVDLYSVVGTSVIPLALLAGLAFTVLTLVVVERLATGFRRMRPEFHSIYEKRFWRHERFWKLSTHASFDVFNGTPFKGLLWRLLGVRVGRRVFDDGCSIPERTIVSIGDDCTLNTGSSLWCHSLEDGTFKSDRIAVGSGVTLGVGAFVHYGVTMGEAAVLEADSFLMKGEELPALDRWQGNPARPTRELPGEVPGALETTADMSDLVRLVAMLESRLDELTTTAVRSGRARAAWALVAAAVVVALATGLAVGPTRPAVQAAATAAWRSLTAAGTDSMRAGPPLAAPSSPTAESPTVTTRTALGPDGPPSTTTVVGDGQLVDALGNASAVEFIQRFYGHLPGDAGGAFALLTPSFQRRSGSLLEYTRFYRDIASVVVLGEPEAVNRDTVIATIRFQRRGAVVAIERYEFFLDTSPDGKRLMSGFTRLVD